MYLPYYLNLIINIYLENLGNENKISKTCQDMSSFVKTSQYFPRFFFCFQNFYKKSKIYQDFVKISF